MEERRASRRERMQLTARCEIGSTVHAAVILNGSQGGCFVGTQADEPGDAPLKIDILSPQGEWISLWGEVAYYLPTVGFGLQFIDQPGGGDSMFEKWLALLSPPGEEPVRPGHTLVTAGEPTALIP